MSLAYFLFAQYMWGKSKMKKINLMFALCAFSLVSCNNQSFNEDYKLSIRYIDEIGRSRYIVYTAKVTNELAKKTKQMYDYFSNYEGEKVDLTEYDGNEKTDQYYCNFDDVILYVSSSEKDSFVSYSFKNSTTLKWEDWMIDSIPEEKINDINELRNDYKKAFSKLDNVSVKYW